MFLGHAQQSTDHPRTPPFFRVSSGSAALLHEHVGTSAFFLEPPRRTSTRQERQERPAISLQEHPELIRLLNDERFRLELRAKPVEVLARYGVHLSASDVPQSLDLPSLPPPKALMAWEALL